MSTRLTTADFALLAGISPQKARRAFTRALENKPWRGTQLIVDSIVGRGGLSGQSYTVRVASLPPDLQQRLKEHSAIANRPLVQIADNSSAKYNWYLTVLSPALKYPPVRRQHA